VKAVGRNLSGGPDGVAVGRRYFYRIPHVSFFFLARAGVRRRIRFGCGSFGEPPEGGECPPCRRPKAGSKAADEREQGPSSRRRFAEASKDRDAEAGRFRRRPEGTMAGQAGRPDRRRRPSRRRQEEAAGGRFRARAAAIRSNPPPSIRSVQRGCPPTAPRRTAEAQHAASVRAQAARPSAAPCQARRPAGRGVWERRAWRAGWLPQQPA
jgi:hypothetical protein